MNPPVSGESCQSSHFPGPAPAVREVAQETTWVGVVANRGSGSGSSRGLVDRLARELKPMGLDSMVAWTPDERRELVARAGADPKCRCLVAVGGDGTVAALVNETPKVPFTILPAGTENLAAQHFGLRRNPQRLARTIASGMIVRTDLGRANGRRFMLMAGLGFDGDVVTRHHRTRTTGTGSVRPTNRVAYVEPILRASLFYRFPPITAEILDPGAEEVIKGTTVFVFNLPRYALGLPFAPRACQDDGWLDLVIFRDPGPFQALYYLWRVFWGTHLNHPGIYHRRVRKVLLRSCEKIPVQLDGDPGGYLDPQINHECLHDQAGTGGLTTNARDDDGGASGADGWLIEAVPGAVDVLVPRMAMNSRPAIPLARLRALG